MSPKSKWIKPNKNIKNNILKFSDRYFRCNLFYDIIQKYKILLKYPNFSVIIYFIIEDL
jgi:hypothetical protein